MRRRAFSLFFAVFVILFSGLFYCAQAENYFDDFSTNTTDNYETYYWPYASSQGAEVRVLYDSPNQRAILHGYGGYGWLLMRLKSASAIQPSESFEFSYDVQVLREYNGVIYLGDLRDISQGTWIMFRLDIYHLARYLSLQVLVDGAQVLYETYPTSLTACNLRARREDGTYYFYCNDNLIWERPIEAINIPLYHGPATAISSGPWGYTAEIAVDNWQYTEIPRLTSKETAREHLSDLLPTGDNKLDKQIRKAVKHIEKSLDPNLWEDATHLVCKRGKKVFHEEKKAVKKLMKEMKKKKFPEELVDDFNAVIAILVDADEMLAQTQLDDARAYPGAKQKEIEKAEKEMTKAEKEIEKGKYDKAIDHYEKAWKHAGKAMGKDCGEGGAMTALEGSAPLTFALSQNNPNPFSRETAISFSLPAAAQARLRVYDVGGRVVARLVDEEVSAGVHTITWDREDAASGIYFYRLSTSERSVTRKMVVLR